MVRGSQHGRVTMMPATSDHYDVIVIGSGPGGGALAQRLAATGKRILMLERGDYLPRSREPTGTRRPSSSMANIRPPTPGMVSKRRNLPPGPALLRRRQLEGLWGGAVPSCGSRTSEKSCQQADGISPAWPVGYDVFEPYYNAEPEKLFHVHGQRGEDPNRALVQRALMPTRPSSMSRGSRASATS